MSAFKVGDRVTWESTAAGYRVRKTGEIVCVVPAGVFCNRALVATRVIVLAIPGWTNTRNHESYIVRATVEGRKSKAARLYWPRVSALEPA